MEEERTYLWPGYLVITTIVMLALFFTMTKLSDETSFNQKYLSKDLALLEETLFVSPGEVNLKYPILQGESRFEFNFEQGCLVEVNIKDTPELSSSVDRCANNNFLEFSYPYKGDFDFIIFNKTKTNLIIIGERNYE
jgi:hypothetical protein